MGKYLVSYTLEQDVKRVLNDSYTAAMKPIKYKSITIRPNDYLKIGALMFVGQIDVYRIKDEYADSMSSAYVPKKNRFEFNFRRVNTIERKALVIHEVTHAIMDYNLHSLIIKHAEAISYIAQCQYSMLANPYGSPTTSSRSAGVAKFEKAWGAAKVLLSGGTLSDSDIESVGNAVEQDPWYTQESCVQAAYDGIF